MSGEIMTSPSSSAGTGRIQEVRYRLDAEDYVDYLRFLNRRDSSAAWKKVGEHSVEVVAMLAVCAVILLYPTPLGVRGYIALLVPVMVLLRSLYFGYLNLLLVMDMMSRRFFRQRAEANKLWKRGQQLHVWMTRDEFVELAEIDQNDGDGVVICGRTESRALWTAVERIDETDGHFFFKMAEKGYLIVPKRIFVDEAAARHYLETVETLRAAYLRRLETPFGAAADRAPAEGRREPTHGPGHVTSPPR